MITDITQSKWAEEDRQELLRALERRVKEFAIRHEVAQIAAESLELDEVLSNSLDKVIELMTVETAAIILTSEQKGEVIAVAHGSISPRFLDKLKELPIDNRITGRLALSGMPIVIEDTSKYPQLVDITVRQEGIRSIAAVPLRSNGNVIGTLIVASHDLHSFSSDDIHLLNTIGEGLGPALKNAQLHRALQEKTRQLDAQNKELVEKQEKLVEKTKEVEKASQAKSEFLAHMSHELRTPLNVVIGFSQLMLDNIPGEINEEQRQCLNEILNSGEHLLNLINDVLDLSKIESGKVGLKLADITLTKVIESLTSTVMPMLAPRKQSLDVELEEGLPPIYADKAKLKQVLLNLLSNATKFTPDGGRLKIEAVREGDWCQVSVVDNGTGIKKEDQERIFEPFSQLDTTPAKETGGTGLGLAIVKKIIEKHGGQVWVESEYEKGSRFTFTLPIVQQESALPSEAKS